MSGFPKSRRLLKSKDFRFRPSNKLETKHFLFYLRENSDSKLGITLPKKSLKSAVARNRIKRLLREAYRHNLSNSSGLHVNCVGLRLLSGDWKTLSARCVESEFSEMLAAAKKSGK